MPKFSIITVNYNDVDGLKRTVESVCKQTYIDFEYIVIDGASNDGSLRYLRQNKELFTHCVSEKDKGVYEAMNKGLRLAKGDYVLFLNSGDYLIDNEVLSKIATKITTKDIYYGNLLFQSKKKNFIRAYPKKLTFQYFLERSLPHPGSFIKRILFDDFFYYNEDYKIVSDWEFFIYAICKAEVSYEHLGETISVFDLQGMSNNPNNKEIIASEKMEVYQKYFKLFHEDAMAFGTLKTTFENKSVQMLLKLNEHVLSKKWAAKALRLVQFFFGKPHD